MKTLIMVSGTMGVGKTTTCRELQKILPRNVFLDGDWCWDMQPFVVNEETKTMVIQNICFQLNQFLKCSQYEYIIFCWVMQEQSIIDSILSSLDTNDCLIKSFSLIADEHSLVKRIKLDIESGIRLEDVIDRSVARINNYNVLDTEKIDVSNITPSQAAELIKTSIIL
ncbi:MAG: AAA family ATPase [Oscillospiraceae bacterium]